uniref:Uncharacterized protein n=1 Tax=Tanacetum cinerariifolium TaxID=118510 RepID=A0A699H0G3_TANCI|nr:hypothetical protein [Tanacetum cinerariifolium]
MYEQYFEFSGIRHFFKVSKQGHWFSFGKRVGKGAGGQIFQETFSRLKGWKQRFFFLDRRAISGTMAWRHHDSYIKDPVLKVGFSMQDVEALTERVIDLRPVLFALLFQGWLTTTWDYPGFHPILKDTEGMRKARAVAKKRERKKQCGEGGEGSWPKTKRRKTIGRKDGHVASEATSSPEPLRTLNPHQPSANRSVHNYSDDHRDEETDDLNLGSSDEQSGRALTLVSTKVIQPSSRCQCTNQGPTVDRVVTPLRTATQGRVISRGALYVPGWSICPRFRADNPMWCRELMVHVAPSATQEESNALNNATTLERAWLSLARGSIAQTEILERFENLQTDFDRLAESHAKCGDLSRKLVQARLDLTHSSHLYTSLFDRHKALKNKHEGCTGKLKGLENHNRELSQANRDQVLQIKELEAALAQNDFALFYAERINAKQAQEKERLRSLSEPFNLAIQAGWGKGLAEERSEEDLLELMGRMEGFNVHADTKMRVDLLDSPPRKQVSPYKPSSEKAPSTSALLGS